MTDHLDLDALADLLADLLVDLDGTDRTHLDACQACQARLAELSHALPAVSAALATVTVPAEPADLAGRLDAALAREARAAASVVPAADVIPLATRTRARWLPALAAVAAAAVLVTGGVLIAQGGSGRSADTASRPLYRESSTGTDYDRASLAAALPGLLDSRAAEKAIDATANQYGPGTSTGTSGGVAAAPSSTPARGVAPQLSGTAADPLAVLRTTDGLAGCLTSLLDPGSSDLPLALDYAAFQGQPALVVVLPSGRPDKVDVFVVGVGCAQADAKLLYFTRLPKP